MNAHDLIRRRIHEYVGDTRIFADPSTLRRTEWNVEFEERRKDRMVRGAYRYGVLGDRHGLGYDYIKGIRERLDEYRETRNMDLLLDIGNFAMVLWMKDDHPKCHLTDIDEKQKHLTRTGRENGRPTKG